MDRQQLAAELVGARVGGAFWAPEPQWQGPVPLIIAPTSRRQANALADRVRAEGRQENALWLVPADWREQLPGRSIKGPANPWAVVAAARLIWVGRDHDLAGVALLTGRDAVLVDDQGKPVEDGLDDWLDRSVLAWQYSCPFSGTPISPSQAIRMLTEWRDLIDANRQITAVLGVASWKRPTLDPLLWDGAAGPHYARRRPIAAGHGDKIAVWKSRTPLRELARVRDSGTIVAELEDGLIRGPGLGANCVPPLSIILDSTGIFFDPSQPSDLENLLEKSDIPTELIERAAKIRSEIVGAGISKYERADAAPLPIPSGPSILVVGQVEDDRSILTGGGGQTNLELLRRTRDLKPDACLIYRPHPDVEAGHRKGHVPDREALRFADRVERGGSISQLIAMVDEVHCITSLAGFEALLRGKRVTAHGVPFYAGWGLTQDLGPVPARRTRRRSLDELVAATLILYPRYVDPVTRLPCPPEVLVKRIASGEAHIDAPLAGIRSLQGKLNVAMRRFREAVA